MKSYRSFEAAVCSVALGLLLAPASAFASRSESAAIQVMNQLVRQFTLRTTVGQVNQGLQGLVVESGGKLRGPAMAAGVTNFPADMGTVPAGLGLPSRDGAGRLLGYCAWDNNSGSNSSSYLGGASAVTPIVYAVLSPGLDGAINTSCADIASSFAASGDDYVEIRYPQNTASQQFKTSVSTVAALATTAGSDGDVRLVLENNKLYTYDSGSWTEVTAGSAGSFGDDSATNGAGAISYTTGKVTVAEFAATAATFSSNVSVTGTSTLTGAVTAANGITVSSGGINVTGASSIAGATTITGALTVSSGATVTGTVAATAFSGNGSALTNLSASNISSGTLGTAFGGTGVDASQASNGSLLIGTGNGFALGALTGTANQLTVTNSSGGIQLSLPQSIASTSTPTFSGLMISNNLSMAGDLELGTVQNPTTRSRAIYFNSLASSSWGIYRAGSGGALALNGGTAPSALNGGSGAYLRFRAFANDNEGFIFENSNNQALMSLSGNSGNLNVLGNVVAANFSGNGASLTNLNASNISSGTLAVARGGTGVSTVPTSGQLLIGNGTGYTAAALTAGTGIGVTNGAGSITLDNTGVTSLMGTAFQVNASGSTGDIVLSLPQDIDVTSSPTFANVYANRLDIADFTGVFAPNLMVGFGAMSGDIQTGFGGNQAVGVEALFLNSTGELNTAVGPHSLYNNSSGAQNVGLGYSSLNTNSSGSFNTGLGSQADVVSGNLSYATVIGANALVSTSNTVVLGRTTDSTVIGATGTASSGVLQNKKLQVTGSVGVSAGMELGGTLTLARGSSTVGPLRFKSGPLLSNPVAGTMEFDGTNLYITDDCGCIRTIAYTDSNITGNAATVTVSADNTTNATRYLTFTNSATGNQSPRTDTALSYNPSTNTLTAGVFSGSGANLTNLSASNISSGTLAVARGGTGVSTTPTNGQLLIGNGDGYTVANLTGTANQLTVTNSSGGITLSLPQNIATSSTPTFGGLTLSGSLTVSTANTIGGGLVLGDDGDIVDLNDGYASMRFSQGVRIYSGNKSGSSVIQLGANGNGVFSGAVSATRLNINSATHDNTAIGITALTNNTTGINNIAVGHNTMQSNTGGSYNVAVGNGGMVSNTTGTANSAFGTDALSNNTSGSSNSSFGDQSLRLNTIGSGNAAVGASALYSNSAGYWNVGVGQSALKDNTTGSENTALGVYSMDKSVTGSNNVAVGFYALGSSVSGSFNVAIGSNSDVLSGGLTYATAIGARAAVGTSNTVVLGRTTDKTVIGATDEDGSGNILQVTGSVKATAFNTSSDRRLKTDINPLGDELLNKLSSMGAYSYRFIADPNGIMRYGVIAQEIAPLFPFAVSYDRNGIMAVDYGALGAIAAAGVGKLNTKLNTLSTQVTTQGEKLTALEKDLLKVDDRVKTLEAWKIDTAVRLDTMQTAINLNIEKIAEHALKIATNTEKITTLEAATQDLGTRMVTAENGLAKLNANWAGTFAKSEDGQTLTVLTPNLVASNFSAEQVRARSAYTERLEAEMARIATLEVDDLRANKARAGSLQAAEMNTGSVELYVPNQSPAVLFTANQDGHYSVSARAKDGSYALVAVMVNEGVARVIPNANEGIEIQAEGRTIKGFANGKLVRFVWTKHG